MAVAMHRNCKPIASQFEGLLSVGLKAVLAAPNADHDLDRGGTWEVRCFNKTLRLAPSSMQGTGRGFSPDGFLDKVGSVRGFILGDVSAFPLVRYWVVPSSFVARWWQEELLGKNASISRTRALELVEKAVAHGFRETPTVAASAVALNV
jgi:hypothetical protein